MKSQIVKLDKPEPCDVYKADGDRLVKCGKPAEYAYEYLGDNGGFIMSQPICKECALSMARLYNS